MVFYADDLALKPIREVLTEPVNDVLICRDLHSPLPDVYYTVVVVKDRQLAKALTGIFENSEKALPDGVQPFICCFTQNELLCYVFDYHAERRLPLFAKGQIRTIPIWEQVCVNFVMTLLSSPLPFPLLALALRQGNVHLEKDDSVFLTPYFDLSSLNPEDGEAECARLSVELMLSVRPPQRKQVKSALLMQKKLSKHAYQSLPELYRDIRVTALPISREKLASRLKGFWQHNKDTLFRVLLVLSGLLFFFALLILISQLIFGDIPFFRLFESCFDQIGTRILQ